MFEKEAEIYALSNYGFRGKNSQRVFTAKIDYQEGAEFGYNKAKEEMQAQIEKMKCGQNCKYEYWKNTGGCYDQKCRFTGLDCTNCKDKWEIKENESKQIIQR